MKNNHNVTPDFLHDRRHKIIICLVLITATLLVYGQLTRHEFINFDDGDYVTENTHVQAGFTLESIKWAFTTGHAANWHPLTWLSHMLDYELYGLNPMGHHWTNLLFHMANTLLLFFLLQKMTGAMWKSAFVAALFALHPLHVESVAWVSERKDVLSTFLGFLAIWAYIRYVSQRNFFWYFMVFFLLSLGLMAKPMLVTLPFVLLLLDFWPLSRFQSTGQDDGRFNIKVCSALVLEKLPLFMLSTVSSLVTFFVQQRGGAIKSLEAVPLSVRLINSLFAYVNYLAKTIWPQNLALIYPYTSISMIWQIILFLPPLICITVLVAKLARKFPYLVTGWLWYIGTLVPVIGWIQVGSQSMADRYTYIPLIGIFIIVVWGVHDIAFRKQIQRTRIALISCLVIVSFMVCTWFQARHWYNSLSILRHTLSVTHNNSKAHYVLGLALDQLCSRDAAVLEYQKAVHIRPEFPEAHNTLGADLFRDGKLKEAISHFNKAIHSNPDDDKAHNNLAIALFAQGAVEKAEFHYRQALKINPENEYAHKNLANLLSKQGRTDEAFEHYKSALMINFEDFDTHFKLGGILAKKGNHNEAIRHFAEAIRINPSYAPAYNEMGIILAEKGKLQKSNGFFLKAIQLKPDYKEAKNNLILLKKMKTTQ